jgi:hypothetical protein
VDADGSDVGEGDEDDEPPEEEEASAAPHRITAAKKTRALAAVVTHEERHSAVWLMALGKPTSWLRRKNIPHMSRKTTGQKYSFTMKINENRLRMRQTAARF